MSQAQQRSCLDRDHEGSWTSTLLSSHAQASDQGRCILPNVIVAPLEEAPWRLLQTVQCGLKGPFWTRKCTMPVVKESYAVNQHILYDNANLLYLI